MAQEDINYQPKTEEYAFSNDSPEKKKSRQRTIVVSLMAEIIGLLVIFIVFLFILNYFKIISLSSFVPPFTSKTAVSSKNAANPSANLPTKASAGPPKKIIFGEIKEATTNTITILPVANKNSPMTFSVYGGSDFLEQSTTGSTVTKTLSFDDFKQTMATAKDHTVKVEYFNDGSGNLADKVTFFQ
jgi:hypothetical protein